eukprot:3826910-Rhodomonas_salina.1
MGGVWAGGGNGRGAARVDHVQVVMRRLVGRVTQVVGREHEAGFKLLVVLVVAGRDSVVHGMLDRALDVPGLSARGLTLSNEDFESPN